MAPPSKPRSSRNPDLIRGIGKYSRSVMYHKRGLWAIKAKNGGVFPKHEAKKKVEEVEEKKVKWYPADDVKVPLKNKRKERPTKLRASITLGTVLIILAGRFKGKRVVFLKQLSSGLLLVTARSARLVSNCELTVDAVELGIKCSRAVSHEFSGVGPFKINGVPLRRVNQAFVIATSTKVDISGVNAEKFDDKYFSKKADKKKNIKEEAEFFEAERKEKTKLPDEKKDDQKAVDAALIKAIESVPDLKTYLGARFSLHDGMKPHELVF
ncbi:Large ribosomal subunit protein eL6-like protein [Drosera capensis]